MGQAIGYVGLIAGLVLVVRAGPVGALAAYLLALLGALCLTFRWLHMEGMRLHPHFDLASLRVALSYGYRGSVGTIVQFFTYRLDLLLVNLWVGTAAAGQYSVAARIGEMMWMLPSAVGAVVFTMSSASEGQQMNAIAPRAFWVTVAAGTLGALLIAALGPIGIPLVFSASFNGAYVPLLILLPGTVLLGASSVLANDLAGRGHPGWVSAAAALAFASTVGLDLLLIPAFGTSGAALASTISYIVYLGAVVGAYLRISAIGRGFLLLPIRHHAG